MISQAGENFFICCWDDMNMIIDSAHKVVFTHKKSFTYTKRLFKHVSVLYQGSKLHLIFLL